MRCANCENEAEFLDANPSVNPVAYCSLCLPKSLVDAAARGKLPLPVEDTKNERRKNSSKAGASDPEVSVPSEGSVPPGDL